MRANDCIAQLLILPILYPQLYPLGAIHTLSERGVGSFGSSNELIKDNSKYGYNVSYKFKTCDPTEWKSKDDKDL